MKHLLPPARSGRRSAAANTLSSMAEGTRLSIPRAEHYGPQAKALLVRNGTERTPERPQEYHSLCVGPQ
ncbi:UNVERIFIED_CONTAM: hypothetical protein HHA_457010 [Hammondia hammondi]|eukprot:XP_008888983.1 hypothetical protein HHA_457010 [Hammondia hammondi]